MPKTDDTQEPEKRPRGRPPGSISKLSKEAREKAAATGILPHEFLLMVTRGEVITTKYLDEEGNVQERVEEIDLEKRIEAAKASAPYFAPKISAIQFLNGANDDELNQLIAQLTAQAGVAASLGGESEEGEDSEGSGSKPRRRPTTK